MKQNKLTHIFKWKDFFNFTFFACFVWMYVYGYTIPSEYNTIQYNTVLWHSQRRALDHWNWNYRCLWGTQGVLRIKPRSSGRAPVFRWLLSCLLAPHSLFFKGLWPRSQGILSTPLWRRPISSALVLHSPNASSHSCLGSLDIYQPSWWQRKQGWWKLAVSLGSNGWGKLDLQVAFWFARFLLDGTQENYVSVTGRLNPWAALKHTWL